MLPQANNKCGGTFIGRQVWAFDDNKDGTQQEKAQESFNCNVNPNSNDRIMREQLLAENNFKASEIDGDVIQKALNYYLKLQNKPDGFFGGDYGGPLFLMPGLIIACYVTSYELPYSHKYYMIKYLLNHQQSDGGWGFHIESPSIMFTTVLNYISLRILGLNAKHDACKLALKFIKKHNIFTVPSWCKWYLCILNIFDYKSIEFPVQSDLWFLPKFFHNIFHPANLWCHCRMVYLPFSLIYSMKYKCDMNKYPLIKQLRNELLPNKFENINWKTESHFKCNKFDKIVSIHWIPKLLFKILYFYEWIITPIKYIRESSCKFAIDYIENEDKQTNYIDIGPVNKVLNLIAIYFYYNQDAENENVKKHHSRLCDYLWLSEDGMKMNGYNGSQLWDTSFALEAIYQITDNNKSKLNEEIISSFKFGLNYLEKSQIIHEISELECDKYFRCRKQCGAWPFSNRDHGWPITDCTAQGLKCTLLIQNYLLKQNIISSPYIEDKLIFKSIDCILNWQNINGDGGWSTYEKNRGYNYYEYMNGSQIFMNIMIDYSHIECTSSCIQALCLFIKYYPNYRKNEINKAIRNGIKYLKLKQYDDGRFVGFWGVCCLYAIWFASLAFKMTQDMFDDIDNEENMKLIESFIISKLNKNGDGGWNEYYTSCIKQDYVFGDGESNIVSTSWALLSLLIIQSKEKGIMEKAKDFLVNKQLLNGDWKQENISGVFNHTCMISYSNYRNIFPIWALLKYKSFYGSL